MTRAFCRLDKPLLFAILVATLGVAPGAAMAQIYTVVDLGVLPGQVDSRAHEVNNHGQIVGVSGNQVFLWEPAGGMRALGVA